LIVPAIPLFAKTFNANATQVGFIISSFAFARFGSGLLSGKFVDAIGERLTLGVGLAMVSISSLLCGFAHSYWQLLAFRAGGGLGSSMFSVSASALLMRSVNDAGRAQAQSIYNSGFLIGGVIGPAFGGVLSAISLRAPFFVYAITLLAASLTSLLYLHEKRLGRSIANSQQSTDRVLLRDAFKLRTYRIALIITFLSNWILFGLRSSILPLFATSQLKISPSLLGFGFTCAAIAQGSLLVSAGKLIDSRGRRFGLLAGSTFISAGMFFLIFATHQWSYFILMILFGLGGAFMGTAPVSIVGDLFGGRGGRVIALYQMAGDAGMIFCPIIVGYLVDTFSYRTAFELSGALFLIVIYLSLRLPETRKELNHS
jgi:MFS family permease